MEGELKNLMPYFKTTTIQPRLHIIYIPPIGKMYSISTKTTSNQTEVQSLYGIRYKILLSKSSPDMNETPMFSFSSMVLVDLKTCELK